MKKTPVIIAIVVLVVVGFLLSEGSKMGVANKSDHFKIGAILPLTGPVASAGQSAKNGIEKAVADLAQNEKVNVEVVYEDSQYDAKASIAAYNKLKETDGVNAIVAFGTPSAMALSSQVNKDQIPLMALTLAMAYTSPDDYTFRMIASAEDTAKFAADFFTDKLNKKRIAVMYLNNDYGIGALKSFKRLIGSRATVVAEEGAATGVVDYRAQIAKIKSANPDGIYLAMAYKEAGIFIKQAKELNINVPFVGDQPVDSPDFIATGGAATEGTVVISPTTASNDKFQQEFKDKYGALPSYLAVKMYDSIKVLSHVASKCESKGYSGACLKDELYAIKNFPGLSFPINYDKNGDIGDQLIMRVVKDGKFVPFYIQ